MQEEASSQLRLTRDPGDRGPSLSERLSDRLDRLSFASPFHRMRLKGRFPLKLIGVPEDPVPGDAATGQRLKGGRLFHDGYGQGMQDARLDAPDAPESWKQWVHGWGWLRDLAAAEPLSSSEIRRAEALAKRWLARFHDYDEEGWAPAATGRRLLMACLYAPLIMPGHDHIHRSAVLNGIARWSRHLERAAPRMQSGIGKLEALTGLVASTLILPGQEDRHQRAESLLEEAIATLMAPDGSSLTRSPLDLARLGDLMLTLSAFHAARQQKPSQLVARTLEQVRTGLGAMAMGDGVPSAWHGGQPGRAQLARLEVRPIPLPPGKDSGFQRMEAGSVRLMVDAGPPPAARLQPAAHASTLAFTMTDGKRHVVVGCGAAEGSGGRRQLSSELAMGLRSTAGHSTLVLADTNSSRLPDGGPKRQGGVSEVVVEARATREGNWLECRHDGWRRRFAVDHLRRLWLSPDGNDLRGEDQIIPASRGLAVSRSREPIPVAVRFHLGPGVKATLTQDEKGALLVVPGARSGQDIAWAFRASFAHAPGLVQIEPSLHIDSEGQFHEIQQILLTSLVEPGQHGEIAWSFKRQ